MVDCLIAAILDYQSLNGLNEVSPSNTLQHHVPVDPGKSRRRNMDIDFLHSTSPGPHPGHNCPLQTCEMTRDEMLRCF